MDTSRHHRSKTLAGLLTLVALLAIAAESVESTPAPAGDNGVVRVSSTDFSIRHEALVAAAPDAVYAALTAGISKWWDPAHTFSGNASNLSIEARPQGCFCETLPNGGGVRHLTVIYADPGRSLRLSGGLGPLQAEGVAGSMSWDLEPDDRGTRLRLTYNVSGAVDGGLDAWAPLVDQVLHGQFQRLVAFASAP